LDLVAIWELIWELKNNLSLLRLKTSLHSMIFFRESDYGIVAREFEAVVDDYFYHASQQPVQNGTPAPVGKVHGAAVKAAASAATSVSSFPKNVVGGISVSPAVAGATPKLPVGRPPKNKMASATSATTPSAASMAAVAASAPLVGAMPPPTTSKAAGKKTK
jgi:hypothetical protein